jgi:metallo-beta-lactamase family protein
MDLKEIPQVPVFVDSPLAGKLTQVYGEHPELYDQETHKTFLEKGKNPFYFPMVRFTETVEESMELNRRTDPHIVLSASGMCEAGRILHHLRYKIHDPRHTVLIVGFMAEHTLGRRILELGAARRGHGQTGPAPMVRILGKEYPLRAHVETVSGFSAHADKHELLRFMDESGLQVAKVAVVHGEAEQSESFRDTLIAKGYDAFVPSKGDSLSL